MVLRTTTSSRRPQILRISKLKGGSRRKWTRLQVTVGTRRSKMISRSPCLRAGRPFGARSTACFTTGTGPRRSLRGRGRRSPRPARRSTLPPRAAGRRRRPPGRRRPRMRCARRGGKRMLPARPRWRRPRPSRKAGRSTTTRRTARCTIGTGRQSPRRGNGQWRSPPRSRRSPAPPRPRSCSASVAWRAAYPSGRAPSAGPCPSRTSARS
mmetsp:Transcript_52219/g.155833  ORF Transcript_52219/g.155833 Transcript_52219/m.155833 type:complete len:210 (+) Transcript_52219:557-1186(+)